MVDLRPASFSLPYWDPVFPDKITYVNQIFPMLEDGLLNETPQWAYLFAYLTQVWSKTCLQAESFWLDSKILLGDAPEFQYSLANAFPGYQISAVDIIILNIPDDQDVYFGDNAVLHCGWYSFGEDNPPVINHELLTNTQPNSPSWHRLRYINFKRMLVRPESGYPNTSAFWIKLKPGVTAKLNFHGMQTGEGVGYASNVGGTLIEANPLNAIVDGQTWPQVKPLQKPDYL